MEVGEDSKCGISTEWLRGEKLCTFRGNFHLAWSVPMSDPSYYVPSAAIHSFLMFAPFFVLKWNMIIQGLFLWATGKSHKKKKKKMMMMMVADDGMNK